MSNSSSNHKGEIITLHELLERSANSALEFQREDGSFPPGRNYTYNETKTPVGTTAHWLTTLSAVCEYTNNSKYEQAANNAVDYLLSKEARPHNNSFHSRNVSGKDKCNGVIGQSGPIRALTHAATVLNRQDALETAEEAFFELPFHADLGLWECVEIDGSKLSFDRTLNHQIIFAARSTGLSSQNSTVERRLRIFLDKLESTMRTHSDGLIRHYIRPPLSSTVSKASTNTKHITLLRNEIAYQYYVITSGLQKKERGYHTLNLRGLALLYNQFPDHDFWKSDVFTNAINFLQHEETKLIGKENTKHGTVLPGVAIAIIYDKFGKADHIKIRSLVEKELEGRINTESYLLQSDDISQEDMMAQISQFTYLPNIELAIPK